ncbi:hypothetical protein M569_17082 [Genlisea aurea]|uniref:Uncharacterized protein n=1 Tax=Genlisea aurea TaxID=192259 RepID=S8BZU4_9LAMI|nr:hypothetical protein M569_17082 [Genlisea aurea]
MEWGLLIGLVLAVVVISLVSTLISRKLTCCDPSDDPPAEGNTGVSVLAGRKWMCGWKDGGGGGGGSGGGETNPAAEA